MYYVSTYVSRDGFFHEKFVSVEFFFGCLIFSKLIQLKLCSLTQAERTGMLKDYFVSNLSRSF